MLFDLIFATKQTQIAKISNALENDARISNALENDDRWYKKPINYT